MTEIKGDQYSYVQNALEMLVLGLAFKTVKLRIQIFYSSERMQRSYINLNKIFGDKVK